MITPEQVFGLLTTIEFQRGYWYCKCKCGNYISVPADALYLGRKTSCGCTK